MLAEIDLTLVCVQCALPMKQGVRIPKSKRFIPVCTNPKCPNFGLLQIGIQGSQLEKKGGTNGKETAKTN
jgi:hypothetical protein